MVFQPRVELQERVDHSLASLQQRVQPMLLPHLPGDEAG